MQKPAFNWIAIANRVQPITFSTRQLSTCVGEWSWDETTTFTLFVLLHNLTCEGMMNVSNKLGTIKGAFLNQNRTEFMKHLTLLIFLLPLYLNSIAAVNQVKGKVVAVLDGNTVEFHSDSQDKYKVVLAGIDSPELAQNFGTEAKKFLEKLVLKQSVTLQIQGKDRLGNYIGVLLANGDDDPRVELLKQGLAWTSEKNPNPDLEPYRSWAQQKKKGLWQEENPTPPWTFRRQQTMVGPKSS